MIKIENIMIQRESRKHKQQNVTITEKTSTESYDFKDGLGQKPSRFILDL